jgi:hypothetical protein
MQNVRYWLEADANSDQMTIFDSSAILQSPLLEKRAEVGGQLCAPVTAFT